MPEKSGKGSHSLWTVTTPSLGRETAIELVQKLNNYVTLKNPASTQTISNLQFYQE